MKKAFKCYFLAWLVLLVLFNALAYFGLAGEAKYTVSFWIGYVFITLSLTGQLVFAYFALRESDVKKTFFNISLVTTSYTGLILSVILGGLCMLVSSLPYWLGAILCISVLLLNVIAVVKASVAIDLVEGIDQKIEMQTSFVKSLTSVAESLIARARSEPVKKECKKVYEAVCYSDPMSSKALAPIEGELTAKFAEFSDAVDADNFEIVSEITNELLILLGDWNRKCKLLK